MNVMSARQASTDYFNGQISYWKLLELAKAGQIPHFRIGGKVFFRADALDQWIESMEKNQGVPPKPEETHKVNKIRMVK